MKKFISVCIIVLMFFSSSLQTMAYELYPSGDGKIIVSGKMDYDYATGMVVYSADGSQIVSIGQVPEGDGDFEYVLPLGTADGQEYTVIIKGETELTIKNISAQEALSELNLAASEAVAETVRKYKYIFGFDLSLLDAVYDKESAYTALADQSFTFAENAASEFADALSDVINNEKQNALLLIADGKSGDAILKYISHFNVDIESFNSVKSKTWVYSYLNGNTYTESEFEAAFADAVIIANINDASGTEFINLVRMHQDKIGLDLSEDAAIADAVFAKADKMNVENFGVLKQIFKEEISLYKLNQADKDNVKSVLESENDVLGILDVSGYSELSPEQKNSVCRAMFGGNFATIADAKAEFSTIIDRITNPNKPSPSQSPSKPSSGGGLSISGGSSGDSAGAVSRPQSADAHLPFSDISSSHWGYNAVSVLYAEKIISGTGANTFEPDQEVTREEFVKMLVGTFGLFNVSAKNIFSDIPDDSWCIKFVASAYEKGLVTGKDDGTFGIGEALSRQDMATLAARCADIVYLNLPQNDVTPFADESEFSDYASNGIYTLARAGIINGIGNNTFSPSGTCTRVMAAKVCYELWKLYSGGVIR